MDKINDKNEPEERLEDFIDMDQVRANENTPLGKTTMSVGRDVATLPVDKREPADAADKEVKDGIEEMEKNTVELENKEPENDDPEK